MEYCCCWGEGAWAKYGDVSRWLFNAADPEDDTIVVAADEEDLIDAAEEARLQNFKPYFVFFWKFKENVLNHNSFNSNSTAEMYFL